MGVYVKKRKPGRPRKGDEPSKRGKRLPRNATLGEDYLRRMHGIEHDAFAQPGRRNPRIFNKNNIAVACQVVSNPQLNRDEAAKQLGLPKSTYVEALAEVIDSGGLDHFAERIKKQLGRAVEIFDDVLDLWDPSAPPESKAWYTTNRMAYEQACKVAEQYKLLGAKGAMAGKTDFVTIEMFISRVLEIHGKVTPETRKLIEQQNILDIEDADVEETQERVA